MATKLISGSDGMSLCWQRNVSFVCFNLKRICCTIYALLVGIRLLSRTCLLFGCALLSAPAAFAGSQLAKNGSVGHLATLHDAKEACRYKGSIDCLRFLAEAVAVVDTLKAQAFVHRADGNLENKVASLRMIGQNGIIVTCNDKWYSYLNGQSLLSLAVEEKAESGPNRYWSEVLLSVALRPCVAK